MCAATFRENIPCRGLVYRRGYHVVSGFGSAGPRELWLGELLILPFRAVIGL